MGSPVDLLDHVAGLDLSQGGLVRGESLVLALSGGQDSVALLDVLVRLRSRRDLRLHVAHLDHALRPQSADDADFCRRLCEDHDIPCHVRRVDIAARAVETGLGLEGAGRAERYRWFHQVREAQGADRVATAHHRDDHIETLLMWLFRGTGLRGMRGIPAVAEHLVRPLRDVPLQAIREHVEARGLAWVDDPMNRAVQFRRNRIRTEILPLLEDVFDGGVGNRVAGFAARLGRDLAGLEEASRWLLAGCTLETSERGLHLDRSRWLEMHKTLQFHVLREILAQLQPAAAKQRWNEASYSRVLEFTGGARTRARIPLPGGGWLEVGRSSLWFLPASGDPTAGETLELALAEEVLPPSGDVVTFPSDHSACFDADRVRPPVTLRFAQTGDRIQPLGMQGHKKLTDLFRERDIPLDQRSSVMVVEDTERIIWAVGITMAEDARPTEHSQGILKLTLERVR